MKKLAVAAAVVIPLVGICFVVFGGIATRVPPAFGASDNFPTHLLAERQPNFSWNLAKSAPSFQLNAKGALGASGTNPVHVPPFSFAGTNKTSPATLESLPAGIYQARPFSGIIIVPEPVDDSFMHTPADTNGSDMLIVAPPLYLEQKK